VTPDRWKQISQLYDAARARPANERAAFLAEACALDGTLLSEVQSLLDHPSAPPALEGLTPSAVARAIGDAGPDLTGQRFGGYLVQERIGAGGMGDVYRARDTRLGRDVAIKVLPHAFAADADRRARFEREARLLASLDHPHIGAIYGVEESDGVRALVLALVEGDTLAERLEIGSIPVAEALGYARQIASALETTHDKGIIHRDLKPDNIKITPDGLVKVLDFGIAKAVEDSSELISSRVATTTNRATREGMIIGSANYMSPEQGRGEVVDERTDIWAFGCVLYEMLGGRKAFGGATMSDVIAAVLEREPDWSVVPASAPPALVRLLHRCLDKDPKRRLHSIADARIEIEDLLNDSVSRGGKAATRRMSGPGRLYWVLGAAASVAAIGAVFVTLNGRDQPSAPARTSRLTFATSGVEAVTANRTLAITPDGSRVVYIGNHDTQVFVRPLDRLESTVIATGAAPIQWVCVSPDGQWVSFVEGSVLKKVAITGGPVTTITENVLNATWLPDDTIVTSFRDRETGLRRVSASGGPVSVLTRPDAARGELDHELPEALKGGRAVLYSISAITGGDEAAQVAVLDLATGVSKVLVQGGRHAQYVSSGHLIYTAGSTLRAVRFDLARLETQGPTVTVLPRLARGGFFAVAADGTLAYVDADPERQSARTLVWVDRDGREEALEATARSYMQPRISPDGKLVAVAVQDEEFDIWVWDLARKTLSRRTFDPANDFYPVWTPDGERLIWNSQRPSGPTLFWQRADGGGEPEALTPVLQVPATQPSGMTPDGTRVLLSSGSRGDLLMVTIGDPTGVKTLVRTQANERLGVISPDGRWLAYESDSSGQPEIYARPFPSVGAGQWLVSSGGGRRPLWAPNGRELFYENPTGAIMAVPVDASGPSWRSGNPVRLIDRAYVSLGGGVRNFDISPDGRRFLTVKSAAAFPPQIVVVQNWMEELKRLVPAR
jgi:serine/threonine-protein kinase